MGKKRSKAAAVLGTILSLASVGATVFFGVFFIGEGWPDFMESGIPVALWPVLALVLVATVGAIWSFFDRRAGGWILVVGGLGLAGIMLVRGGLSDLDAALTFSLPYMVPGLGLSIIGK